MHQVGERPAVPVDVSHLLPVVAAHGLPGAPGFPADLPESLAFSLVTAARSARLTGTLLRAVRAGAVALPDEAEALLVDAHRQALLWCMHLERRLLEVDDRFGAAGIPFVVVKGSAVAHLDLADPGERTWSDVDVLIAPEHIDRAVEVLEVEGSVRRYAEARPGWDRRFGKSIELVGADGVEVDLHRTLADGVFGERIPLDHLHATTDGFTLAGRPLRALSPPARVLHTAYHAVIGSATPTWANLRDLARAFSEQTVPLADVVAEAERWRGEAVLVAAVEMVRASVVVDAEAWFAWADAAVVDPRERALASRVRHGDAGVARARLDLVGELVSYRDRAAYLRGLVLPVGAPTSMVARCRRWVPHLLRRSGPPERPGPG